MDRQSVLALVLQILLISAESESQPKAPSSWPAADVIHLSPLAVKSMPYRDFRIKFYRRQNDLIYDVSRSAGENQQPASIGDVRYFYTPIGSLDHRSAVSYHNNVTGESELRFVIHLWDDELEDAIAKYLKNVLKTPVRKEDLEVIPFQRIYLELNTKLQEFVQFESRKAWTHYYVQERYIWPRMKCPSTMDCNKMAEQMRLNPTQFSDCFQLKFLMESQQRSRQLLKKEISIEASSLVLGRLYSRVESKFQRQNYVLLTPLDTRQLIFESVNKIISQNFDDGAVVDDSNMYASLEQLLVPSKQNMNGQPKNPSDGGWDLLYWEQDENYRPDKLATIINQIYNLSDSNGKRKLIEVFRLKSDRSKSYSDADLSAMFEKFAFTVGDFLQRIEVVDEPTPDDYDCDVVNVTKVAEDKAHLPSFKREMMTSEALFSQSGFHVIPDQINQTKSDWDAEFSDISEEHKTLALKMLMASGNVIKWTGKEFVLKPQKFSKLNLAKLRGRQADSRAMFKISVPYLEADMVMNPKIDVNFYWTPERDLKVRLQDALLIVEEKFKQVKSKMTSNYTALVNDREKEIIESTAARLHDALRDVDEKFHQMELKMKSNYTAMTSNYTALVNDREKEIVESTAARLQNALLAVDEKFQQMEFKMASNYTEIINVRQKMLHDYTTRHEALEESTSKKINELHHLVEQEVSNLGNQTNRQFSEQTAIRNALIQSVKRRQAIALQLSNEAYEESLRQLRAQVNRGAKLGRMPSSCRDLWTIGHSHTGYYIVQGNNNKHPIEILYCDMADRGNASSSSALQRDYSRADSNEKWIGYSDVKTSSVYFYAQRLTTFSQQGAPVPFQAEILNAGGAFRLSDGTFSVPTPGIYHFSFSGLRAAANHFVHVSLQVNGKRFGSAYSGTPESNKVPYRPTSLSLQSVLELRRGDQVRLFLEAGAIGAETPCQDCVHFSGMLLTEYL